MDSLTSEELRRLTYRELKDYAKKQGIKRTNLKAGKLISAILSAKANDTLESLSTCDESLDNSCLDQSQVSQELPHIRNMSSRTKSRRKSNVFSAEKTFEENKYSSEDSEIELKTPMLNIKVPKIVCETDVSSMGNNSWSEEDLEIELKTPKSILKRSGTFSVEVPVTPKEKQPKLGDADVDVLVSKQYNKHRSASLKKVSIAPLEKLNVLDVRKKKAISEDQTYAISTHSFTTTPVKSPRRSILRNGKKGLPLKNVKSSGNTVNFITPDRRILRRSNSETPLMSVKDRPKTPVAIKHSVKRKRDPSPFPEKSPKYIKTVNGQSTPKPSSITTEVTKIKLDKGQQTGTPLVKSVERKPVATATKIQSARKEVTTPFLVKKNNASEANTIITPNFKDMHQKAFDKMENLEDYQKRLHNRLATLTKSQKGSKKEVPSSSKGTVQKFTSREKFDNSEPVSLKPSRIPQPFRGIPFIPVVKSIRKIDTNFAGQTKGQSSTSKCFIGNENANPNKKCQRSLFTPESARSVFRFGKNHFQENATSVTNETQSRPRKKFDLKASLAMKLPYKPHRGILKPLSHSNANQSQCNASCLDPIKKKRKQSREILKGVRKNRRFELQMSRREIS